MQVVLRQEEGGKWEAIESAVRVLALLNEVRTYHESLTVVSSYHTVHGTRYWGTDTAMPGTTGPYVYALNTTVTPREYSNQIPCNMFKVFPGHHAWATVRFSYRMVWYDRQQQQLYPHAWGPSGS